MNATARRGVSSGPQEGLEVGVACVTNHSTAAEATHPADTLRLQIFRELAPVHARMAALGAMDFHEAVDSLQYLAERFGLIETIGQDAVQGIMAAAFDMEAADA